MFQLQAIGVKQIIARAQGLTTARNSYQDGLETHSESEQEVANNIAEQLTNPGVLMCVNLPNDHEIIEVSAPSKLHGRTLQDIG